MNANNEFDKLVKDKLANGQPSVPKDAKAEIERMLVKQGLIKKDDHGRKYFYVTFSVIAFLAILTASVFKIYNSESDLPTIRNKSFEKSVTASNSESKIIEQDIAKQNSEIGNIDESEKNRNTSGSLTAINTNEEGIAMKKTVKETGSEKRDRKADLFSKKSRTKESERKASSGAVLNNNRPNEPIDANAETAAGIAIANSPSNDKVISSGFSESKPESLALSSENDFSSNVSSNTIIENKTVSINRIEKNGTEAPVEGSTSQLSDTTIKQKENIGAKSDSVQKVIQADSTKADSVSRLKYSIEAFGGIQQTYMQNMDGSGGSQSSTQSQSNSEWIAGVKFSMFFKKHFTVGVGINYSMHHSEIAQNYNSFMYDSSGVVPVSFPAHVKTDFNVTEIPILIGYYFEMKKFAIHLESGVSVSLISNANSVLKLDDSSQSIDNFSGVSPVKSYSSFVGQFSLLYSISRRFQVFLQPSINVGLSEIFEGMPDRKINVVSGRTGLRMNF